MSFRINDPEAYYFCTDTIVGWQYVFTSREFFDIIIDSFKFCQKEKGLLVHAYVIMPNHVHTILSTQHGNLPDIIRDYKRFTSKEITRLLLEQENNRLTQYFAGAAALADHGNDFKVWQTGSHPESLISGDFFMQKLNYIHNNPVRKGFVELPEHWLYSSARNYVLGDQSIIQIDILE